MPDPLDMVVESIITDRVARLDDAQSDDDDCEQFLVKYKGFSYHETEWLTEADF
jgi:hypothetical protein